MKRRESVADATDHTEAGAAFKILMFEVFRTNNRLEEAGDRMAKDFGLNSARWRVLGAACEHPKTVSTIARERGLTRQAVQQIVNSLIRDKLVVLTDNAKHRSSKLVSPTRSGKAAIGRINRTTAGWANDTASTTPLNDIQAAIRTLEQLRQQLERN